MSRLTAVCSVKFHPVGSTDNISHDEVMLTQRQLNIVLLAIAGFQLTPEEKEDIRGVYLDLLPFTEGYEHR